MSEKSVQELLMEPRTIFNCSDLKETEAGNVLKHKLIGMYFSASWCPPCKEFTQILSDAYRKIRSTHGQEAFEVVLVPLDRDHEQWQKYIKGMPWLTFHKVASHDSIVRMFLRFTINKVPRLVIVDGHGEVVCDNARGGQTFGFGLDPLTGYSYLRDLQKAVEQNRARLAQSAKIAPVARREGSKKPVEKPEASLPPSGLKKNGGRRVSIAANRSGK